MSQQLSPDGQWRWDGQQWVPNLPAPPERSRPPVALITCGLIAVAIIVLFSVAVAVAPRSTRTPSPPEGSAAEGFVMNGTLALHSDTSIFATSQNNCEGTGGYKDIQAGTAVTVRDEKGTVIATTQLGPGTYDPSSHTCSFKFRVIDLDDHPFYQVEVSHRGAITESKEEVSRGVEITLGS